MRTIKLLMLFALIFSANQIFGQEQAPLKTFQFTVSVNHLKTQEQADKIVEKMNEVKGVENCSLILTEYVLTFTCTNHNLEKYQIIDMMKQIFVEEDAGIVLINRETIKQDEFKK
ncbi:MAG: hypothetical protein ACWA41_09640 [Putridiphycobacter sp.]